MATEREEASDPNKRASLPSSQPAGEPSAADLRRISEEISALYPPPRLGTELVLLEVNPHRAHAYWSVDLEDFESARARSGLAQPPLVLRLYDITGIEFNGSNAHTAYDIEVQGLQGHWYIDLWMSGRTHVAELGFRTADGRLVCLARSNPVATPPSAESREYNTLALNTGGAGPQDVRVTDLFADSGAGDTAAGEPTSRDEAKIFPFPVQAATPAQEQPEPNRDRAPTPPATQPWQGPASAPTADRAPDVEGWPSAEELERHVPDTSGKVPELPHMPAPAPAPVPSAPMGSSPMPLDRYVTLSSFELGRREVALEVNVELHVYGRAKPGTELTLYGQPVPVRPDGTFSVRKPLPHGAVVLPLLAVDPPRPNGG